MADEKRAKKTLAPKKKDENVRDADLSNITNKIRRQEMYQKQKAIKAKERRTKRKNNEGKDEDGVPKKVQKTIDNLRVADETMVEVDDEEVMQDAATDEFASYFSGTTPPKILFTTCNRPRSYETLKFIEDLPNSDYKCRKGIDLKKIIPQAVERGYTDVVVINEDHKKANGLVISHLPDGPTAHFKLTSITRVKKIK